VPLFGSAEDASFVKNINKELLQNVIGNEVELYKLSLDDTKVNIYSEGTVKTYYNPIKVCAIIDNQQNVAEDGEVGLDKSRLTTFGFLRDHLKQIQFVIEVGDIIGWDNAYFEVDNILDGQYWIGRNNETLLGNEQNQLSNFYGLSVSVIAECHIARESSIQLSNTNYGIPKTQNNISIPKNL